MRILLGTAWLAISLLPQLPSAVAEDHGLLAVGTVGIGLETSSQRHTNAKHVEEIRAGHRHGQSFCSKCLITLSSRPFRSPYIVQLR